MKEGYGIPPAYRGPGATCKHEPPFKLNDPATYPAAQEVLEFEDPKLGRVRVTRWSRFYFPTALKREMELIRVEVIEPTGRRRAFQPLWLAWLGQTLPPLERLWRKYSFGQKA